MAIFILNKINRLVPKSQNRVGSPWITSTYWRVDDGKGWTFQPPHGGARLACHAHTSIQRHVKVQGARSPYDGDWVYWSKRVGHHPDVPPRVARLLKQQQGRCRACGLYFTDGDKMEVDHILPKKDGGRDARDNVQLLHRHCHDTKTARETGCQGTYDTRHVAEEPDERKRCAVSRTERIAPRGGRSSRPMTPRRTTHLDPKGRGNNSMSVKQGVSEDVYGTAMQRLRDRVRAGWPKPQCPVVEGHTRREHVWNPTPLQATGSRFSRGTPCAMDDA